MRLPDLHTAPMRHLIKFRAFLKKAGFIAKTKSLCDVLKVLHLVNFLKFGTDIQNKTKFPNINAKLLFSIQVSCATHFLFVIKDNSPPLPCESINFIIFLFILHHKYQNNLSEPKTS